MGVPKFTTFLLPHHVPTITRSLLRIHELKRVPQIDSGFHKPSTFGREWDFFSIFGQRASMCWKGAPHALESRLIFPTWQIWWTALARAWYSRHMYLYRYLFLKLFAYMQIASMSAFGRRLQPFGPLQYCSLRCSPSRNKSTPVVGSKECYRNRSLTVNWEKLVFGHSASFKNSQE